MHGTGLRKVAFVAARPAELHHFMIHRLLKRARGLQADHFWFLTCDELSHQLIKDRDIKVLVPLGESALRRVVGEADIERWRGRVVPHAMGIWVVPTFAPSKLLASRSEQDDDAMRNPPRFHGVWMRDVVRAVDVAVNGFTRRQGQYLLDPNPVDFIAWVNQALAKAELLSTDIETVYKQKKQDESEQATTEQDGDIIRIGFSWEPYTGCSVPYVGPYRAAIAKLLASAITKVVWNGVSFDVPRLIEDGNPVGGEVWDGMDAYHLYETDLPKGLEWATSECTDLLPWKHLSLAEPALYNAIDADAALRCMLELRTALQRRGQWQAFYDHSVNLMPILARAGIKGNRVDIEKQAELREKLSTYRAKLLAEAQPMVPRELKPRKAYKRWDPEIGDHDVVKVPGTFKVCSACQLVASNKSEHFKGGKKNPCKAAGGEIEVMHGLVDEYHEVLDFNPNSNDQLANYIRHFGHPMGRDKKNPKKETCDAKHIEKLVARFGDQHPVYALSLEFHKLSKVLGTYLPEPDANGYIHTEYVNSPSTWRLGSRKVVNGTQIQNWGKRESNKWAKEARNTIIASPGCKLIQIDSASVEAVMLGWFMGDAKYIELASKGVHSWLCCQQLGWEFNKESIARVKSEYETLYDQMKIGNHMTNYGGTAYVLWQSFPKLFHSKEDAERVQAFIYQAIPKLRSYHHNVRWRAQKESFLETPWKIRHYFYDVFTQKEDGTIKDGKDAKRVVAFEPQSSNGTFQRDNLRLVAQTQFGEFLPAIANVHDSLGLDCPDELVDGAVQTLLDIFTRPIPQMNGLRVGAEVEVGSNWGKFDKVKNPGGMQSVQKVAVFEPGLFREKVAA